MNKEMNDLYQKAHQAGIERANEIADSIKPMIVEEHKNMLDDSSKVVKQYVVEGGPCGFAWINIRPGNCKFANWLKKNKLASADSYYGGVSIWVHEFGQSMALKEAYAQAFSRFIEGYGIKSYSMSRMD